MPKCESEVISKWGAYNSYQPLLDRAEITTSPSSLSSMSIRHGKAGACGQGWALPW